MHADTCTGCCLADGRHSHCLDCDAPVAAGERYCADCREVHADYADEAIGMHENDLFGADW